MVHYAMHLFQGSSENGIHTVVGTKVAFHHLLCFVVILGDYGESIENDFKLSHFLKWRIFYA